MTRLSRVSRALRRLAAVMAWGTPLAACGSGSLHPNPEVAPGSDPCVVERIGPAKDTISVALPGPVRPGGAPPPLSPAERFLAHHLGDSAGALDCIGRPSATLPSVYRIASADPLVLLPSGLAGAVPAILLQVTGPGSDPRDVIDRGTDLLITSDAVALEYARNRGDRELVPLAWTTTYLLVSPPGTPLPVELSDALRAELARDAVRAEARPADTEAPGAVACATSRQASSAPLSGIAVTSGEPIARALAERLVALSPASGPRRVLSYAPALLDSLLARGGVAAYVLPVSRFRPPGCLGMPSIPRGSLVAPLIDVRPTAVVRSGVASFLILGDGTIRFLPRSTP